MESYGYGYPPPFPPMGPPEGGYPDRGDGFGEYYDMAPLNDNRDPKRRSRSNQRKTNPRDPKRARSRSRSKSQESGASRSHSLSRSHSRSQSRSRSNSRQRELNLKEPSFLDAFRVLYLTPSKHKRSTTKYLATKKRQDRIQEVLKSDGLGSKRWLFYPRPGPSEMAPETPRERVTRDSDRRVKIDRDFFRKYKRSSKVDSDAPIAKLKRWELLFYKKLGFIQAV